MLKTILIIIIIISVIISILLSIFLYLGMRKETFYRNWHKLILNKKKLVESCKSKIKFTIEEKIEFTPYQFWKIEVIGNKKFVIMGGGRVYKSNYEFIRIYTFELDRELKNLKLVSVR